MTSFEIPQDTQAGTPLEQGNQEIVSANFSFAQTQVEKAADPVVGVLSGGEHGAPFVIDAEKMKQLTPEQSVALAGEMVRQTQEVAAMKQEAETNERVSRETAENRAEAEQIAAEIKAEEAALEAKYGPKESWPDAAKKEHQINKLGWGLVGVAGLSVAGGLAAQEAHAFDLGGVVAGRINQGVQIESGRMVYQEQAQIRYEQQRMQLESRIENGRMRMEENFQRQEMQKNQAWQQEWARQTTEQARQQVKARQDAEWNYFVQNVQMQRQQFEANANMQRQQLDQNYQMRAQQVESVAAARQRQANVGAIGQVITRGAYGLMGR